MPHSFNPLTYIKAGTPIVGWIRGELKLRDADEKRAMFSGLDTEMSDAIAVLTQNADTPGKLILEYVKGFLSGRPDFFDTEPTSQWLRTEKVQTLIKQAVQALIDRAPAQAFADEAAAFFATFPDADGPGFGYTAFEYAVAFVALAVSRDMKAETRLLKSAIDGIADRLDDATAAVPVELLDAHIAEQLTRIRQSRFYEGSGHVGDAERLVAQLQTGNLVRASDAARARGIAWCARFLGRALEPDAVSSLIDAANRIEATEAAVVAHGFLKGRGDAEAGLAALAPIDTPAKRTAAIQIMLNERGADGAVKWAEAAGIGHADLDGDGRNVLISSRLQAHDYAAAHEEALLLTEADYAETPALLHIAALARICHNVPDDLKHIVAAGTPLNAAQFPLADSPKAMAERKLAATLMHRAAEAAERFGCAQPARGYRNVATWLDLMDPETSAQARQRLEEALGAGDPIAWVPLGLAFDVPLDMVAIEKALTRAQALNPKGDGEIAFTRLAIVTSFTDPAKAADYLVAHRAMMLAHLSPAGIADFETNMLTRAGRTEEAERRLEEARDHLDAASFAKLEAVIRQGAAGPSIAEREAAYAADPSTVNLAELVSALSRQGYSENFLDNARRLVAATQTRGDAENLVAFLVRHDRHSDVAIVLAENESLIAGSPNLREAHAWSAFRQGDFKTASTVLAGLRAERDVANDRALHVNILITSGRWPELSAHVEDEWALRDQRTPAELLHIAQLAAQVRSTRVEALIALAAEKAPADPEVLSACYMLSTQIGLEASPEVHRWFETAAQLSGDDGPIQSADIEELVSQAPDWQRRSAEIWDKLKSGAMPLFLGAKMLRRPSLELQLIPMIANLEEPDPRRRIVVPAYSGHRGTPTLSATTLAIDGSSLITLAMLDLLGPVLARWPITIPHLTLGWLFSERQRLGFHQPSRIAFAHRLSRALAAKRMAAFVPSAAVDEKLVDVVGRSLAAMLASAEQRPADARQRIVVRSAPVLKVGSFRGDGVDLSQFADQLCSCLAVIDKLVEAGQLTQEEEAFARAYLEAHEKRWEKEPAIEDGAELYLDDLSVSFLNTAGVLDKLHAAGLKAHIPQDELDEANGLIDIEARAAAIDTVIERLRAALAAGIENGTVTLDDQNEKDDLKQHPDMAVVELGGRVDAIVCDDRYINRNRAIESPAGTSTVWTTLDLLDLLRNESVLSDDQHGVHRTTLRRTGLVLFPICPGELGRFLARAKVKDGVLVETGELRAFRENLLLTQMRGWLTLPAEAEWLHTLIAELVATIAAQWTDDIPDADARARSNWLFARADMRDWAGMVTENDGSGIAIYGLGITINNLILNRPSLDQSSQGRFDAWLQEDIVDPFEHADPKLYAWLIGHVRDFIRGFIIGEANDDGQ